MMSIEKLDEERLKMWVRIEALENSQSAIKGEIKGEVQGCVEKIDSQIANLSAALRETDALAKSKSPDDEQVALRAAQSAVQSRDEAHTALTEALKLKDRINEVKSSVDKYENLSARIDNVIAGLSALEVQIKDAKDKDAHAQAAWATINQQSQNVALLNEKVSSDAAKVHQSAEDIETLRNEVENLKTNASKNLSEKESSLGKLLEDKSEALDKLVSEIEKLIPGAITSGLASSFAKRSRSHSYIRLVWALSLVVTISVVIWFAYDLITPFVAPTADVAKDFPRQISLFVVTGRAIILGALILLEEFFRRNFNIASRLEESYAYKAVTLATYHGCSEELKAIEGSNVDDDAKNILARIILEKLADEPGKIVFDREKHEMGPTAILSRFFPENGKSVADKVSDSVATGKFLANISWQVVSVVIVIVVGICFLAALLFGFR